MNNTQPRSPLPAGVWSHQNLCSLFQQTADRYGDAVAFRVIGGDEISWAAAGTRVQLIAQGLHELGVRANQVVAMLMPNVPEFHLVDLAILHLGAVPFSLYATDVGEKMATQLRFCDVRVLVVHHDLEDTGRAVAQPCDGVHTLVLTAGAGTDCMTLETLQQLDATSDLDFDGTWRAVPEDATACILFTSGTTGQPKLFSYLTGRSWPAWRTMRKWLQ
jgi:long-chain acyl-CoA synthetase